MLSFPVIRHRDTLPNSFYPRFTSSCSLSLSSHAQQTSQPLSSHALTSLFSGYLPVRGSVAQASACALSSPQPKSILGSSSFSLLPLSELRGSPSGFPQPQVVIPSGARNQLLLPLLTTNHQPLPNNSFGIRTYEKLARNPFGIRTGSVDILGTEYVSRSRQVGARGVF